MKKLIVVAFCLFISACAYKAQPIYNIEGRSIPTGTRALSIAEIQDAIIDAGQSLGWRYEVLAPGRLRAVQDQPKYAATVEILFDERRYSMTLVSSRGLREQGTLIHSHYNVWARNLEKNIDNWLFTAARRV